MGLLRDLVQQEGVSEIVVGIPYSMSGNRGVQVQKVEQFIEALKKYVRIPIHEEDERLSTFEAEIMLNAAGRRKEHQKEVLDSVAASVILESFLERRRHEPV
jgi:putative Holliday junction resolvase